MAGLRQLRHINTDGLQFRLVDAKAQGKDKPCWNPWGDVGDVVIVKNASQVNFTGQKWAKKEYIWHTGYPGGLKRRAAQDQHGKDPCSVLWKAVNGMLPKNKLRQARMCKLLLFPTEAHDLPETAHLVPWEPPPRSIRRSEGLFELPSGFEPLNVQAYTQRFGHQLSGQQQSQLGRLPQGACIPQLAGKS